MRAVEQVVVTAAQAHQVVLAAAEIAIAEMLMETLQQ
jgi:hypothetical protein